MATLRHSSRRPRWQQRRDGRRENKMRCKSARAEGARAREHGWLEGGLPETRHDWELEEIKEIFKKPMNDLLFEAHSVHRAWWNPNRVQTSSLLSIKTGSCPEGCKYCAQSSWWNTNIEPEGLMEVDEVVKAAEAARDKGATRFCMGAAWRRPTNDQLESVIEMIRSVRELGLETCVTLGSLTKEQADKLAEAKLDYYNHNLDTSPEYYNEIVPTRTYEERLRTVQNVRDAGIKVCTGGIIGMQESRTDRASLLQQLANMPEHPGSVPINLLIQIPGTPLYGGSELDPFEFVRTIAVARLLMPYSYVRLAAGRTEMHDSTQAMCFFAGANSLFYGDRLLTTDNPEVDSDLRLFDRLGILAESFQRERASGPYEQARLESFQRVH